MDQPNMELTPDIIKGLSENDLLQMIEGGFISMPDVANAAMDKFYDLQIEKAMKETYPGQDKLLPQKQREIAANRFAEICKDPYQRYMQARFNRDGLDLQAKNLRQETGNITDDDKVSDLRRRADGWELVRAALEYQGSDPDISLDPGNR